MIGKFIKLLFAVLLIGGIIFACVKFFDRDTKTISMFEFEVGAIDENGDYKQDKQSICTKEMFSCAGLNVEPSFEYSGTYRIFFYNMDRDFICSTESLTKVYTEEIPAAARYARVVITPDAPLDEDAASFSINYFEKFGYAREVTISVSKNQTFKNLIDVLDVGKEKRLNVINNGTSCELVGCENRSVVYLSGYEGEKSFKLINNSEEIVYLEKYYNSLLGSSEGTFYLISINPGEEVAISYPDVIAIEIPLDYEGKVFLYALQ